VTRKEPSDDWVREFGESLPRAYRDAHGHAAIREHAGVALRRGDAPAAAELLTQTHGAPGVVCVVADDRPGLLATISAAFVLSDLDVIDAEAHTRRTSGGRREAVDLFWVRYSEPAKRGSPVGSGDVEVVQRTLLDLLEGRVEREAASRRAAKPPTKATETTVRFVESADGDLATLEVETDDRSGLLLALAQALFEQRVQIVESAVRTSGSRVLDRFSILELDGRPIRPDRRLDIQVAVLSAIQLTG
jgi:[protein-PII] uridylyltransferase